MSKIMTRRSAAFVYLLLALSLAACDNASDRPQTALSPAPPIPPAPAVAPATAGSTLATPSQPAPATPVPDPSATLLKPAGVDPKKLAEHAKGLDELGYQAEAIKLYSHACHWGHSVSCNRLAELNRRLAQQSVAPTPTHPPAQVAAPTPAPAPAPASALASAPSRTEKSELQVTAPSRHEISRPTTKPVVASPTIKTTAAASTSTPQALAKPSLPAFEPTPVVSQPVASQPPAQNAVPATQAIASLPPPPPLQPAAAQPMQATTNPLAPPSSPPLAAQEKPAVVDTQKLFQQADKLDRIGYTAMSIKLYKDACLAGEGAACKRLGEIYIKGSQGVERDYAESVRWYDHARHFGMAVPNLEKRTIIR